MTSLTGCLIGGYLVSVVLAYGMGCFYWDYAAEHLYPNISDMEMARRDQTRCAIFALFGPAMIVMTVMVGISHSTPIGIRWNVRASSRFVLRRGDG